MNPTVYHPIVPFIEDHFFPVLAQEQKKILWVALLVISFFAIYHVVKWLRFRVTRINDSNSDKINQIKQLSKVINNKDSTGGKTAYDSGEGSFGSNSHSMDLHRIIQGTPLPDTPEKKK